MSTSFKLERSTKPTNILELCPSIGRLMESIQTPNSDLHASEISVAHNMCQELFNSWNAVAKLLKTFSSCPNVNKVLLYTDGKVKLYAQISIEDHSTESTAYIGQYTQNDEGIHASILVQPYLSERGLFWNPYSGHKIALEAGRPVVTFVFRNAAHELPRTPIEDRELQQNILDQLYKALQNYTNSKDCKTVTMPRTNLLVRLNNYLQQFIERKYGGTTRDPVPRSVFTPTVIRGLENLEDFDMNRVGLLEKVPEMHNGNAVYVCVCRLSECCAYDNCKFCVPMMEASEFDSLDRTVWVTQRTPIEVSVFERGSKIHNQEQTGRVVLRASEVPCKFGDKCRWNQQGICKFKHK